MLNIHTVPNSRTAAMQAAQSITDALMGWGNDAILLLLSGGSPLEILDFLSPDGFDGRVTVGVSDERFSTDPGINNFAQVISSDWFKKIKGLGIHTIDTRPLLQETLQECGVRFDEALKQWKKEHPTGKIIITQGIGLDGHTAGMMPARQQPDDIKLFNELFNNPGRWAIGYDAGNKNKYPLRVTTTIPFLMMVDLSILFVCGPDKLKPIRDVVQVTPLRGGPMKQNIEDLAKIPGRIIHSMPHCLLYTDLSVDTV